MRLLNNTEQPIELSSRKVYQIYGSERFQSAYEISLKDQRQSVQRQHKQIIGV